MHEKRPEYYDFYTKILNNPGNRIKPEWVDSAIINWVRTHMGEFTKDNPHVCDYLVENNIHLLDVAENIPISPEYSATIVKLLANPDGSAYAFMRLCERLVTHGMPDLIAEAAPHNLEDTNLPTSYVKRMSSSARIKLLNRICWHQPAPVRALAHAIVSTLSGKEFAEAVRQSEASNEHCNRCHSESRLGVTHNVERLPKKVLSIMLRELPMEDAQKLYEMCKRTLHGFICMKCGSSRFKSKSGYTLHRKKCDPLDEYPVIDEIMRRRMAPEHAS
jgi:hypothetical protein